MASSGAKPALERTVLPTQLPPPVEPSRTAPVGEFRANLRSLFFRSSDRFTQVDGLRALAILWVFASHIPFLLMEFADTAELKRLVGLRELQWALHGHFGVDIFFVISGFLIGHALIEEVEGTGRLRLSRFYVRRLMRLFPVYLAVMVFVIGFAAITQDPKAPPVKYAWTNFLYLNNFVSVLDQFMVWTWSLAIEEQFYLLCPLMILLLYRRRIPGLPAMLGLIAAGFAINALIAQFVLKEAYYVIHPRLNPSEFARYYDFLYDKLHTRYAALLCGVAVAFLIRKREYMRWLSRGPVTAAIGTAAGALLLMVPLQVDHAGWERPSNNFFMGTYRYWFSVGVAALLALTFCSNRFGETAKQLFGWKPFYPVAQVSYSLYLIHPVVIYVMLQGWYRKETFSLLGLSGVALTSFAVALVIAAILYLAVEKPLMNRRPR